jgi:hypothetical protein
VLRLHLVGIHSRAAEHRLGSLRTPTSRAYDHSTGSAPPAKRGEGDTHVASVDLAIDVGDGAAHSTRVSRLRVVRVLVVVLALHHHQGSPWITNALHQYRSTCAQKHVPMAVRAAACVQACRSSSRSTA